MTRLMAGDNVEAEVLNGGVAGYSSNQELLKFTRDVLPLKADWVLCLEGVNEAGHFHSSQNFPMVHPYQKALFEEIAGEHPSPLLPNTLAAAGSLLAGGQRSIESAQFGTATDISPAQQWEKNIRAMHAIAEEFGVEHIVFLQPLLGYGKYTMSAQEAEWLEKKGEAYPRKIAEFYDEAKEICKRYPYCIDLTDAFENETEVYINPRHQNVHGSQALAKAIWGHLKKRLAKSNAEEPVLETTPSIQ